MELTRRSLLVYGFLAALWVLVVGWQAQEHIRVREAARTDLRNRSKDIANTISAIIRGMRFRGAIPKERLEPVLNELVKLMTTQADWRFRIEGHTDSTGSKAANQTLSAQRAASVAAWLAGQGIDKSRLVTQGLGDSKPVADNGTEEGRAKNRRVELVKM